MPATVVPITGQRQGQYVILEAVLPERSPRNIGVLLVDTASGRGWVRMRERYDDLAAPEDAEVLEALDADMRTRISELGGTAYLASLEDSLSNVIRVSDRQAIAVDAFTRVIDHLYQEHVESSAVQPFRTHVPLYSLRA